MIGDYELESFRGNLVNAAMESLYSIERLHWLRSMFEETSKLYDFASHPHPHIIHFILTNYDYEYDNALGNMVYKSDINMEDIIKIGKNYKYSDSVNNLAEKIVSDARFMMWCESDD